MILSVTIGDTLVGFRCKKTVLRLCRSGIKFCAFSKVPPVLASAKEDTTVLRFLDYVKIGPFGVGLIF